MGAITMTLAMLLVLLGACDAAVNVLHRSVSPADEKPALFFTTGEEYDNDPRQAVIFPTPSPPCDASWRGRRDEPEQRDSARFVAVDEKLGVGSALIVLPLWAVFAMIVSTALSAVSVMVSLHYAIVTGTEKNRRPKASFQRV